ncbi:MAG: YeeE/YedE family protein [Ilumatobacteraceae bacterium]
MSSISSNFSPGALTTNERRRVALVALAVVGFVVAAYALTLGELPDPARPVSLLLGAALGFAFERGRFCFFCLYRDAFERRITRPLLSIVTAIAVGAVGYALMFGLYLPNPKGEGLPPAAHISPVSLPLVAGACAFGCGMVLSGACISGHLYRIGQGYLRAIPALVGALVGFGLGFFTWNTLYLEQVSESPVLWLPRWLGYSGSLVLLLAVLGVVAWVLMRLDRSEPVAPRSVSAAPTRLFDVLFARRWSPVATGVVVGAIGIAAYLRSTPLGVTSQLSTVSRSYLDSREMLPEVLHGIDMMRGCVAIVASTITNNGWLVIGFVIASFVAALAAGNFKVQRPTVGNSVTAFVGGLLLGWGSLTALGCTVGVLLSGTQAFALSGVVFLVVVTATVGVGVRLGLHKWFNA